MLVYFVAAVAAGFYLFNVPVRAAVEVRLGQGSHVHLGVGVFGHARIWTLNRPLALSRLLKKRKPGGKVPLGALKYLKRHATIARLTVRVSAGDACYTALVCGALQAILLPFSRRARVTPAFNAQNAHARALCIADAPLGHIMAAALWCAASITVWRVRAWIKGRLKAS